MIDQSNLSTPIVVFASGRGSNFESICESIKNKALHAKVSALIVNVKDCGAIEIAKKYNIPFYIFETNGISRNEHEKLIMTKLKEIQFDWIILAGYMRILSSEFIKKFQQNGFSKIINIHPSLLPSFKGVNGYKQAYEYGSKISGCTIHFVDEECDHGMIISQKSFEIKDTMSLEDVENTGIKIENEFYPITLQNLFHSKWNLQSVSNERSKVVFQ